MKFVADMHTHTLASDHAYSTISENAASAAKAGLSYLGMTDHCINMEDSPHIWHFCNMGVIPHFLSGVRIIKGVEADLTGYNGELDINDDIYYNVEWINASMHNPCIIPRSAYKETEHVIDLFDTYNVTDVQRDEIFRFLVRLIDRGIENSKISDEYVKAYEQCDCGKAISALNDYFAKRRNTATAARTAPRAITQWSSP